MLHADLSHSRRFKQAAKSAEDLPEGNEKVFIADSMPQQSVLLRGPNSKMAFVARDREPLGFPRQQVCHNIRTYSVTLPSMHIQQARAAAGATPRGE